jgi:hypothetical protein
MSVREPILKPVAVADLRPSQMTVGIREVKEKRKRWHDESKEKGAEFLGKHMIPVVLGPKDRHYVIDHHHLAREAFSPKSSTRRRGDAQAQS